MGGGSKKQTVGYKYFLGMHMVICHGPIDGILAIIADKKVAWEGFVAEGAITIDKEKLFGGTSSGGEGGISGTVDILSGSPTQLPNDYLVAKVGGSTTNVSTTSLTELQRLIYSSSIFGGLINTTTETWTSAADAIGVPAFRGVCSAVLRQVYLGMNPYIKPWAFKIQRILVTDGGAAQWYATTAVIGIAATYPVAITNAAATPLLFKYHVVESGSTPGDFASTFAALSFDDSGWASSIGPFGQPWGGGAVEVPIPPGVGKAIWTRKRFDFRAFALPVVSDIKFNITHDDSVYVYWNGVLVFSNVISTTDSVTIPASIIETDNVLTIQVIDGVPQGNPSGWYFHAALNSNVTVTEMHYDGGDMNPAHIIRECLVSSLWGLGYQTSDVDDVAFTAAADALYLEGFGLSMLWDRSVSIEDFIGEVLRHIDASLYIDKTTGKFVLKLIRYDYTVGSLTTLGDADIIKVDDYRRPSIDELTNSVSVIYDDAVTYDDATVSEQDIALVQMQGCVIGKTLKYPGISHVALAQRVARRDLAALSNPILSCTIYATRKAASLNIGDVFKFEWSDLHTSYIVMRVVGMAFGDGRSNQIKLECVQDVFSLVATHGLYSGGVEVFVGTEQEPTAIQRQIAVEAPYYELVQISGQSAVDGELAIDPDMGSLLATAGKSTYSINASLYTDSGGGYEEATNMVGFCPTAILSNNIGRLDSVIAISSGVDLEDITIGSHAQIGTEIVRVDVVTTSSITIGRGVLDTVPVEHLSGDVIFFWDYFASGDSIKYGLGDSVSVKLLARNDFGEIAIGDAVAQVVAFVSRAYRPFPPGNLQFSGVYFPPSLLGDIVLTWAHRNRLQQTSGVFNDFEDGNIGPEAGTTYTIRVYDVDGGDLLLRTVTGEAGTTWTYTAAMESTDGGPFGSLRFEVESVRDTYASYQFHNHTITRFGYGRAYGQSYGGI